MRFCMVTTFYPPYHFGGDATYVASLSRALVARGHSVEVIHCEDAYHAANHSIPRTKPEKADDGVIVHRIKSRFGLLSPLLTQQTGRPCLKSRSLEEILDRDFDVVNFHNISLIGGPGILGMSKAPVTLYTLHEHWLLCPTHIFWKNRSRACDKAECFTCCLRSRIPPQLWRYTGLIDRSLECVDSLISPSEYTAERHRAGGISMPVKVIPLFSTLDPPSRAIDQNSSSAHFLLVGRVTASKGVGPVVEYFSGRPEYRLTIAGDGDLLEPLREKYSGCDNIRFTGKIAQNDLTGLYQQATALLFPSLAPETFGLAVVEAFACSTPVVVRDDSGGSPELVRQSGAGIVYRSDEEMGQAIDLLAGNPEKRRAMGKAARQAYESRYTPQRHVDDYLSHIAEVMAGKKHLEAH